VRARDGRPPSGKMYACHEVSGYFVSGEPTGFTSCGECIFALLLQSDCDVTGVTKLREHVSSSFEQNEIDALEHESIQCSECRVKLAFIVKDCPCPALDALKAKAGSHLRATERAHEE